MDSEQSVDYLGKLLHALREEIESINSKYLYHYCDKIEFDIKMWEKDSKACVLLAHAAFENFFESIAYVVSENTYYEYKFKKNHAPALPFLIWAKSTKAPNFELDWSKSTRIHLIEDLEERIKSFHFFLTNNNHGIKIKHLNEVLRPVGIELSNCKQLILSLEEFSDFRGSYAHRFLNPGKSLGRLNNRGNPEKIRKLISDCLTICGRVYLQAISLVSSTTDCELAKYELYKYYITCLLSLKCSMQEGSFS